MIQLSENDKDTQCHAKAKARVPENLHTRSAGPERGSNYRLLDFAQHRHTCPAEKLHQAIDDCIAMREFPNKKNAD